MFSKLIDLDTRIFLFINERHNSFFDPIMYWFSNKWFWVPLYAVVLFLIFRAYKKRAILISVLIAATITLSDQISSSVIKPWVKRLRPSHTPDLEALVHLNLGGPGGMNGFTSSHAANSFALVIFLVFVLNSKFNWLKWVMLCWALLVCYSRVYNGVHFPGDILGGAIVGSLIGFGMAQVYRRITRDRTVG